MFSLIIHRTSVEDKQIDSCQSGQGETRENIYLVIHSSRHVLTLAFEEFILYICTDYKLISS